MIVCGSAGTGKSYLINCIKEMLGSECILAAATGVAAFNIGGQTLHSLLRIPLQKTSFSNVQGLSLRDLQKRFEDVRYFIINEMSMVVGISCHSSTGASAKPCRRELANRSVEYL